MNRNAFTEQAHLYARFRPVYPDEMYRFIFNHLNRKQTAWDCGTGSGQVAGYLADHIEQVYASDINPEQLKHAVQKKNIDYTAVPAENTNYPSGFFDLITVAQAIHWFDFQSFYKEVNRVANKEALIAVFGYGKLETDPHINPVIKKLYHDAFGSYYTKCRDYIDEEYKTIPFPFEEISSPRFVIRQQWTFGELEGFFNSWSSIQRFKNEQGFNPADTAVEKIRSKIPGKEPLNISFPVFLRLGRIQK